MDYLIAIAPPVIVAGLFALVVRSLVRADRSERKAAAAREEWVQLQLAQKDHEAATRREPPLT